jgi:hypothetical protein
MAGTDEVLSAENETQERAKDSGRDFGRRKLLPFEPLGHNTLYIQ